MICNSCGVNNKEENKFCINCGDELIVAENTSGNDCPNCGAENDEENKFCISCGHQLNKNAGQRKNFAEQSKAVTSTGKKGKSKKQLHRESKGSFKRKQARKFSGLKNLKLLWITVGVVLGSVILATSFDLIFRPQTKDIPVEIKSSNPVVEAKVFEIASKFVCSCGTCNEESLEVCTCGRAVEERQFIRDYLEQNQKSEDIVVAVANKYGWLKAEFASAFNVDASKVWNPNQLQISNNIIPPISPAPATSNNKATISDRYTIYSAFNCPCGQCRIDELKDCNCPHPNGAKEVKKFIDEKINENKYSVNDIIDFVDKKYGGKKI
ncbi:MAG: zinc-ribbon domain-containing protein [Ignavibacteriota bacterium]|jgi:cytochrome c-type biogenesis protein CcmH/NrfF|nr:zinc-ribbon domain-containing protein [Ignavibacteriota bacterium]MBV6420882.1 hypothetical protein [Ignavibacteriaceae bacterium]MCO6446846.1 zinc ribbon domain-containing protein [Ignavibacterium album]MDT3696735.1 zinc ribbon domain-containing protein [Ignavibacterium sp.]QQS37149.1 MAG: zinc ribbon domain-containing protein [Ignavibacteriales bacterium]